MNLILQYILFIAILVPVVLGLGLLKKALLRLSSRLSQRYLRLQAGAAPD